MRGQLARTVLRGGDHRDVISLPDLSLDLTDPGFDYSVLSEFRGRLVEGEQETLLLDTLLVRLKEAGLVKSGGRQRTDSTHVLASIRGLNRLETIGWIGGCTDTNELNFLAVKTMRSLGVCYFETQARV